MKTTEEKTVKQWLNTLKDPYKTKAIRQTNKHILDSKSKDLISSLYCMFNWDNSFEGYEYWSDLASSLVNAEE